MNYLKCIHLTMFLELISLSVSAYDFEKDGIYYNITSPTDLTCEVTNSGQRGSYGHPLASYSGHVVIPSTVTYNGNRYSVTSIGSYAFYDCTALETVFIPESVVLIGLYSFVWCSSLTTIKIPESVTEISYSAFDGCYGLRSVEIPCNIKYVRNDAFGYCSSLEIVYFNATECEEMGSETSRVFDGCKSLTEIIIGENVRNIPDYSFGGCSTLCSITVPASVEHIGRGVFNGSQKLQNIICKSATPPVLEGDLMKDKLREITVHVPYGSYDAYANAPIWRIYNIQEMKAEVSLSDTESYSGTSDIIDSKIHYVRDFTSVNWQPLYLPFSLKYEDWADKAEVAYINNVHQFDDDKDGTIDRTILEFITKTSGTIEPNKPYIIKPKQTGEVTFTSENTTLYAAPATDGYVDCMSTTTKYTLCGTYQEKTDVHSSGVYCLSGNVFVRAENSSETVAPFRIYLKIESRDNNYNKQPAPKKVSLMVDGVIDQDATSIQSTVEISNCAALYNLNGQRVHGNVKGIVVKNGKKVVMQ